MTAPPEDIWGGFVAILLGSPPALVSLVLCTFIGYGLAYVILVHGRLNPPNLGNVLSAALGIGFTAIVFMASNYDILGPDITTDQISARAPFTFLIAFAVSFVVLVAAMLLRGEQR
jgi:hypothetical protein